jgi:hypothetical protein
VSWWSELVCNQYPDAEIFEGNRRITNAELMRFARIILTEGIPFAFADTPMAFEFGRQRAAERIGVDPKQISMTGSARIGYSLNPDRFGRPYDPTASDIDLLLIDQESFSSIAQEYKDFIGLFDSGELDPSTEHRRALWEDTKRFCPANIKNGFIDQKFVPTFDRFPMSQRLGDAKYKFQVNVNSVLGKALVTRTSLRAYRDWNAAVDQIAFSLKRTLDKRQKPAR